MDIKTYAEIMEEAGRRLAIAYSVEEGKTTVGLDYWIAVVAWERARKYQRVRDAVWPFLFGLVLSMYMDWSLFVF